MDASYTEVFIAAKVCIPLWHSLGQPSSERWNSKEELKKRFGGFLFCCWHSFVSSQLCIIAVVIVSSCGGS